ncbi:MAG: glycoside hydrolase family 3 C-terminal domain-containing protein [Ruminococcus sp.]|nr:glycoside hydrolase family 3 C-terminal domain-containing protein [Ruminococcus sp.]
MDIERLIKEMTVEEKAALVSGTDSMYTNPIPRLDIPSLSMADGPHGVRKQNDTLENEVRPPEPATAFPTAAATASSWDPDVTRRMGEAMGRECRHYGVHILLGPGVNIKRNPLCGRNFEYFSEDPLLAGVMGAGEVEGIQSQGVGVALKHFAMNNNEDFRFMGNSVASENTIRKIYLKSFEYIVKKAKPASLMCAYNQINGVFCSENKWLLTDVLRDEWGFDGVVMSDWGAVKDRVKGIKAGLDLEMPGDTAICRRWIIDSVADGSLLTEDLDKACRNILRWIDKYVQPADPTPIDREAHHELAAELAAQSAVLMKNNGALPLSGTEKLHITGELFENMRYQGAGSSMINSAMLTTTADVFRERGIKNYSIEECDTILVFAGLTDEYETEGGDRENMRLPQDQLDLIKDVCASGKKVVVILFTGSPVELPFFDDVDAVLNMYLPGQNGGTATAQLLFGEKNPSGKLAETWPMRYEDVPSSQTFGKGINEVYSEGTDVGYRYYNKHNIPVRCPFGFGLSYTTFEHSGWERSGDTYRETITNTGDRSGAEVAQLYIDGELRGFKKVFLNPGESQSVEIVPEPVDKPDYPDTYTVFEEPAKLPITIESRFTDFQQTFMGRILYRYVMSVPKKSQKAAEKMLDGPEKVNKIKGARFLRKMLESNSPRTLTMEAGQTFPYNFAQAFVELANGHIIKGIGLFLKKIDVPKLPKDE